MGIEEHFDDGETQEGPTNRSFGLTVGGALLAIAGYLTYENGLSLASESLLAAGALLVVLGAFDLAILTVPNRLWMGLGRVLFTVVNPVIMLLMYVICFVPVGLGMRLFGYDPLRRRFDASQDSYWVAKEPGGTDDPMKHQF